MRIHLVSPELPITYWDLQHGLRLANAARPSHQIALVISPKGLILGR
jgi:hypothetical protein